MDDRPQPSKNVQDHSKNDGGNTFFITKPSTGDVDTYRYAL